MGKYLIGIDIGTQGTKTSMFDLEGREIAEAFEPSNLISPVPGIVEQIPEEIFSSVLNTLRNVMGKAGVLAQDIAAIGLDGQMAGIIGIDEAWNAVTCYDSWLDNRCEKYIEFIRAQAEEKVILTTGCPVTYAHGPKILWWKYEKPDIYRKIAKFIMPTTYVAGKLTGLKSKDAFIDYTHLHFSGFGDIVNKTWSEELLNIFKVDKEKLPEIVEPWKIVGYLTEEAAEQCGLLSGIPVIAGCGDQAATSLGAGVTRKGIIFDVAGTASVFSCCVDTYNPDVKNKTLVYPRSVLPNLWIPLAYISGGGLCVRWFRDNFTGEAKAEYAQIEEEANGICPGSEGLVFVPHFNGRVCPNNPNVRGSWLGLNWKHQRGHLYKAVMEGIAYEYIGYLNILKELSKDTKFSSVFVIGGGSKSRLFNSIKSDVLGIPYITLGRNDTATLGSAVVAGYGVGIYKDIRETIDSMIEQKEEIQPNIINHEIYKEYIPIYEYALKALENTYLEMSRISL